MDKFSEFLKEMALGQAHYHPDLQSNLMKVVKINQKFADVMKKLPGITFNVIFLPESYYGMSGSGIAVEKIIQELGMTTSGTITCCVVEAFDEKFNQYNSSTIMPATAWARVHRICHGLIKDHPDSDTANLMDLKDNNDIYAAMKLIFQEWQLIRLPMGFQFKSFRDNSDEKHTGIDDKAEFFREILTEYIWHGGQIRFKYSDNQDQAQRQQKYLEKLKQSINSGLKNLVGQIVWCK